MAANQRAITISSDTEYTASYTPSMPTFWKNHRIVGGGPRVGKVFIPRLNSEERKELRESLDSSSPSRNIRRRADPSPINGPPG